MNVLARIAPIVATLAATCALAADPDPHAGHHAAAADAPAAAAMAPTPLSAQVAQMRELMDRIDGTTDAQERAKLLREHLDAMAQVLGALRAEDPARQAEAETAPAQGADGMKKKMEMMKQRSAALARRQDAFAAVLEQLIARERLEAR